MTESNAPVQYYRQGVDLYAAGHYGEALTTLKKVLVLQPDFPDAYFKIACIYTELERYADAESLFEKIRSILPNDQEVAWTYGRMLLKAGLEKKGVKVLKRAIKLNPSDPRPRVELSKYHLAKDQFRKSLAVLEAGMKAIPEYAPFHALAGDVYRRMKKLEKAQQKYEQCLEIDPEYEPAKRGFNTIMRAMESDAAGGALLSMEEEAKEIMLDATQLYANGKYDQVILLLLDIKNRPGIEREASMMLGLAFARKGLYKRAYDVLLDFTKNHTSDISVWYNLGLAANRMGRYEDAIDSLAQALTLDEDFEEALIEMGIACQMTGELGDAQRYFLRALKINRRDARPYAYLARMAFERNETDKTKEFLKRAESCDPKHPSILLLLGYMALVKEEYKKAEKFLRGLLDRTPDHFEALKLMGRARLEMQDFSGALDSYLAASSLNPSDEECKEVLRELSALGQHED